MSAVGGGVAVSNPSPRYTTGPGRVAEAGCMTASGAVRPASTASDAMPAAQRCLGDGLLRPIKAPLSVTNCEWPPESPHAGCLLAVLSLACLMSRWIGQINRHIVD